MVNKSSVPPEGGWGWMIVLATALSNICVVPITTCFGLIFKNIFEDLGLSHQEESLILNTNAAFGMLSGLIIGALLKKIGYRKVSIAAGVLVTLGLALTAFADSFLEYFVYYGLLTSLGIGMILSSYFLALNSYFVEKRAQATGLVVTLTGIGPVLLPQLIVFLLKYYTAKEVILITSALSGHTIMSALLLQPVEWHSKVVLVEEEIQMQEMGILDTSVKEQTKNSLENCEDLTVIYGYNYDLPGSTHSLHPNVEAAFLEALSEEAKSFPSNSRYERIAERQHEVHEGKKNFLKKFKIWTVNAFDLTLLSDPIFCNIMMGMSIAIFAEMNFMILLPFIFSELGLTLSQNATCLSILAMADVVFRFLAPFIGGRYRKTPRIMYMFSLCLLISSRSSSSRLLLGNFFELLGFRGFQREKFANASGMQMMINGACILVGGPVIGFIRDVTGSYRMCILVINCLSLLCVVMWTLEMVYFKFKNRR